MKNLILIVIFINYTLGTKTSRDFTIKSLNTFSEQFHYSLYSWSEFSRYYLNNGPSLVFAVSVTYKNKIFVFGGKNNDNVSDTVYVFDIERRNWEKVETYGEKPEKRYGHSGSIFGNFLLIFGGHNGQMALSTCYKLNLNTLIWTRINLTNNTLSKYQKLIDTQFSLSQKYEIFFENYKLLPRYNHKMIQINDFEFVMIGGRIHDDLSDEIIVLDAVNDSFYLLYSKKLVEIVKSLKKTIYEKGMYNIESTNVSTNITEDSRSKRLKALKGIISFKNDIYLPPVENMILAVYENILYVIGGYETINYENKDQKENIYSYDLSNIDFLNNISSKDYFLKETTGWNSFSFIENGQNLDKNDDHNLIDKIRESSTYIQRKEKLFIAGGCNKLNNHYFEDLLIIDFKYFSINHIRQHNSHFLSFFEGGNLNYYDSHIIFFLGKQLKNSVINDVIDYDVYNNRTLIMKIEDQSELEIGCSEFQYGNNCQFKVRCRNKCNGKCDINGECICYPGYKGINCDEAILGCQNNCTFIADGKNISSGICQFDKKLIRYSGSVYGNCSNSTINTYIIDENNNLKDNNISESLYNDLEVSYVKFSNENANKKSLINIFNKEIKSDLANSKSSKINKNFIDQELYDFVKNKYKSLTNHTFSFNYNKSEIEEINNKNKS